MRKKQLIFIFVETLVSIYCCIRKCLVMIFYLTQKFVQISDIKSFILLLIFVHKRGKYGLYRNAYNWCWVLASIYFFIKSFAIMITILIGRVSPSSCQRSGSLTVSVWELTVASWNSMTFNAPTSLYPLLVLGCRCDVGVHFAVAAFARVRIIFIV